MSLLTELEKIIGNFTSKSQKTQNSHRNSEPKGREGKRVIQQESERESKKRKIRKRERKEKGRASYYCLQSILQSYSN